MKRLIQCLLLSTLLISSVSNAQTPKATPAWSAKFKSAINWQRVHALGYIIVCTSEALYGVNPSDGKVLWENINFRALDPANYEEVAGTEFIAISYKIDNTSTIPMQAIMEVVSGKVLFDSRKESIGVLSRHVLPSAGKLLVIGVRPKNLVASLFMYDIASGQQVWANDDLFKADKSEAKGFLGKLQAMGQEMSSMQALTSEPYEVDAGSMLLTHPNYVFRINSVTGQVLWKNAIQASKHGQVYFSKYKPGIVYVGTDIESSTGSGFTTSSGGKPNEPQKFISNLYYAFDLNSGAALWKKPATENDYLNLVIPTDKGLIICPRSSQKPTINFIDYTTGEMTWGKKGKGIKAEGSVVSYIPTEKGLLITTAFDNAWNNKAEEYFLNVLDPVTGLLKYGKSVKLKGDLVRSELTPKGLLFVTTKEVNILDTNTGSLVWPSSIEAGNPFNSDKVRPFPVGDNKAGKLFVYSPKEEAVFEVDKQAGTSKKITAAKITFEGKEIPKAIDVVSDGLVISSDQNIMKLGFDGLLKYFKYYPAPREPALMRALLAAEAIRAGYIGAAAGVYSAAFAQGAQQTTDPTGKAIGQEMSKGFGELSEAGFAYSASAMKQFNARYKASMSTPDFMIMMTKQEKKGNQLVRVSKSNGEIMNAIDIKNDKEPEYDVDQIYNYVYYRLTPTEIVCYKLE